MGAARKLVEKTREIVRALGIYRKKEGEQVRTDVRQSEGKWKCWLPISWTMDLHRICDGRVQIGLLLRIFSHTSGAPVRDGQPVPRWTPGYIDEDWAKELDVARNTVRDAINDAVKRGLIERQAEDPKAKGRSYYKLRLTPENWPTIADPIAPRKQPAVAETPENEDRRPDGNGPLHRVRAGFPMEFQQGHRYEFEVPAAIVENYLDAPGKLVLNAAGLLRIEPARIPAAVVEMPAKKQAPIENKAEKQASRSGGLQRNGKFNLADIPLTVAAVRATGFRHDNLLFERMFRATREAVTESGGEIERVTDALVARAIPECRYPSQTSAGGFVKTVPGWVATHLTDADSPPVICRSCRKEVRGGLGGCQCTMPQAAAPEPMAEEDPLEVYRRAKRAKQQKGAD